MGRFVIDYDADKERYFTRHKGYILEHDSIGALVGELRKIYKVAGQRFPGYKATRKAQKNY